MRFQALIPPQIRPAVRNISHRLYRHRVRAQCWYMDRRTSESSAPPAMLRFRVSETTSLDTFVTVGRNTASAIETALESIGRPFDRFESVLDFGCGCGRTLIWFLRKFPDKKLCGSDVDEQAV